MIKEQFNNTLEGIKKYSKDEKLTLGLSAFQALLEDLQADNIKLEKENNELKFKENERLYIENERYKTKELRTKINRYIRKVAKDIFNNNFKNTWNYYYNLYNNIHCFQGTQNLELIQDRGHLKEFYNILLSN